jgi:hypothetical protein
LLQEFDALSFSKQMHRLHRNVGKNRQNCAAGITVFRNTCGAVF